MRLGGGRFHARKFLSIRANRTTSYDSEMINFTLRVVHRTYRNLKAIIVFRKMMSDWDRQLALIRTTEPALTGTAHLGARATLERGRLARIQRQREMSRANEIRSVINAGGPSPTSFSKEHG